MKLLSTKWALLLFVVANLITALAVVIIIDYYRSLVSRQHELATQEQTLRIEQNQLILEQSALSSPIRIQNLTQDQLAMHQPKPEESHVLYVNNAK
jgi:cell division protein FtsL